MSYAHSSRTNTQTPVDEAVRPEHADVVAEEGCCNREPMRGGDVQTHRIRRRRVHRGVDTFKYLGRVLDRSDDNWPTVLWGVMKACRVWNRLGKLLRREGAEPQVSAVFYRAVVQTVLLLGAETRVLSEAMSRKLEGVHVVFLRQITGKREV